MNGLGDAPVPAAMAAIVRPEATERSFFRMASPSPAVANASRCLISSQFVRLPPMRSCFMRTSTQLPLSFDPASTNLSSPLRSASAGEPPSSGSQKPRSQSITVPPPYSPLGMAPSKSP